MYINEVSLSNFKSYGKEKAKFAFSIPNGEIGSGLNILIGENNTGKSTLFEAIDFIRNSTRKSAESIKNRVTNEDALVEITFSGDIEQVIDEFSQPNKTSTFKKYTYEIETDSFLKASRSTSDIKTIKLWDTETQEYKNETGIDAPLKKLFETNFVWADTNPNDETSFGSSTICGNLLKEISNSFTETKEYKEFNEYFHKTFNSDDTGLRQSLRKIEERTQEIFNEQFGSARITFRFNELKVDSFFKNTCIEIDDGINTPMGEKGSGMQRSVALALLQVYAEELVKNPDKENRTKPFFLFIDEPEICLHPKAQFKLFEALLNLSKTKQIFLATHSPFFLKTPFLNQIGVFVCKNSNGFPQPEKISGERNLLPWSPTWGEIIYSAYNLPTVEFHNELYGYLQNYSEKQRIADFDAWLVTRGFPKILSWIREGQEPNCKPDLVTLQTFIRNSIHHPENLKMQSSGYTREQLKESIEQGLSLFMVGKGR
jgi:predicted ATP-dependent endonuclease of OLD family